MQKTAKHFFVFSLLLIFLSNVSGISVNLEHANHTASKKIEKKNGKEENGNTFSQDDQCQCALHFHMNSCVIPEVQNLAFVLQSKNCNETLQTKVIAYRCLIDFFSSRAPPYFS